MKQLTSFFGCALLALALFLSSGCKKLLDYIGQHPGQGGSNYCAIKEFAYRGQSDIDWDTLKFSYNAAGNPVTITRKQTGTSQLDYVFRYDKKGRMTTLIGSYGPSPNPTVGIEVWNKYFYDATGRIVLDSVYFFPDVVDGQPIAGEHGSAFIVKYEYDAKDRVTKATWVFGPPEFMYLETYASDAHGKRTGGVYA